MVAHLIVILYLNAILLPELPSYKLVDIFRAKIVDIAEDSLTIEVLMKVYFLN